MMNPRNISPSQADPVRLGRLSMSGVSQADALRAAMQVPVPPAKPKGGRKPRPKKDEPKTGA